ncbi:MAG: TonB-dependent receptor [Bacteroidia bacterium]|nr:TonB-dependent receptor [Bacteroidia bacterium]
MKGIFLLAGVFCFTSVYSQTQTIRGKVTDKESQQVLKSVSVQITTPGIDSGKTAITDNFGEYLIENVGVGRHSILVKRTEYKPLLLNNIIVSSGKEVVLNIEIEEEIIEIAEVKISVKQRQTQPNNENALVSARLFTVDETDRFAGSRGDPARMASNFAGVQGADDSRNDIVVRGNSPQGVLWRLEGIDIPNPNHFAIPGTTGGPVSIINNKILANSDFFTGAFPAEYGNSTAGAFDLKMRNGNNKKREYSTQFGFLGWDLLAEGPFSKNSKSSYMATYRYSTLALFETLNIKIGTDAVPQYQDASFKLNFPLGTKGNLSFFGIGGSSKINILISDKKESSGELYGDDDRDQLFGSRMGIAGSAFTWNINSRSYFKGVIAVSHQTVTAEHRLVFRHITDTIFSAGETKFRYQLDSLIPNLDYRFRINSVGTHLFVNTKINSRTSIRYGAQITRYGYKFQDSARNFDFVDTNNYWKWFTRWNSTGFGLLLQPYVQMKWQPRKKILFSAGLTSQVFTIHDDESGATHSSVSAIQPRLGFRYSLAKGQFINFGAGMHSQIQPAYTYFYILPGNSKPHNLGMGMTKSTHLVLGYDRMIGKDKHAKIETYYQNLSNIPVEQRSSSFSLANTGSGFSRFFPDTLKNTGTGYNYGIEFTFEKSFTKGYYYLTSLSLFDAKYKGSDGVIRNSDFNTNYAFNTLIAKEWKVSKRGVLNAGGKITLAGARRYSPMDTAASKRQREYIEQDALKNTLRFGSSYARFDIRLSYKINAKKVTHEFAIDIVNASNRKNILKYSYTSDAPNYRQEYQLGLLPLFYYKLDF